MNRPADVTSIVETNADKKDVRVIDGRRGNRKSGDGVVIQDSTVIRSVIVDREAELRKLNLIAESASHGQFHAPKAWASPDPAKIVMQRILYEDCSQDVYRRFVCEKSEKHAEDCARFVVDAGRVLAVIHQTLTANLRERRKLSSDEVGLHGDYGFSNLYRGSDMNLVAFDPFPDFYSTFEVWETGHPSMDLGMFAGCMVGRLAPRDLLRMRIERVPQLLKLFLHGYNSNSELKVSMESVLQEAFRITNQYFSCQPMTPFKRHVGRFIWNRRYRIVCREFKYDLSKGYRND